MVAKLNAAKGGEAGQWEDTDILVGAVGSQIEEGGIKSSFCFSP